MLNTGFGSDYDAWRVARSSYDLLHYHTYIPSRFPGYPLTEYLYALVIDYGWLATNTLTMLISLLSVYVFGLTLNELKVNNRGLLVLTYTFTSMIWINSTNSMDYMWSLSFLIISWYLILKNRLVYGGISMGLSISSRITAGFLMAPLLFVIWTRNKPLNKKFKGILTYISLTMLVTLLFYLPLIIQYGAGFLTYVKKDLPFSLIFNAYLIDIGLLPTIAGFVLLAFSIRRLYKKVAKKDILTLFLIFMILVIIGLFIVQPHETEYLLPVFPFLLIFFNTVSKRKAMVIFCIVLLSHSFISTAFNPPLSDGIIQKELKARNSQIDLVKKLMDANIKNHSIVIVGYYSTLIVYYTRTGVFTGDRDIKFWELAPLKNLKTYQAMGYTVYYVSGMRQYMMLTYGYDLNDYGCILIKL
jgi:hypothetical protein